MSKVAAKQRKSRTASATKSRTSAPRRTGKTSAPTIRSYRSAINFLDSRVNYEKMLRAGYNHTNFNRTRMLRLLAAVGDPHKTLRCVHIAGTKGKGSTAHMMAAILTQSGYRTGLYTSPHLISVRERIAIDGNVVSESDFAKLMARLEPVARKLVKDEPTYFELLTAAAFMHFQDRDVDIAVIETGLGGRLDSTNVIRPEVCGITSISYDHMAQLGTTLEAIAEEKAGIFKPGIPVISAPQTPGVKRVLRDHAKKIGCELRVIGDDIEFSYRFERSRVAGPHTRICVATSSTRFDHVRVPLLGEHQAYNCGVVLGMVDALRGRHIELSNQDAIDGLAKVKVQGRMETIRALPHTIIDAAHNADSIAALMRAIGQNVSYDSMVVVFGCSADKDIDGMLKQLKLGADKVIFTRTGTPRSADPHDLLQRFQEKLPKMAQAEDDLIDAYRTATHCVTREDLICVTGSVHLIGRAKQVLSNLELV